MRAGDDAAGEAGVADLFKGGDHFGVGEFAGDAEGDAEIGRADHDNVNTVYIEKGVETVQGGLGFNLEDDDGFGVVVGDDLGHGMGAVVVVGGGEAIAADAGGGEARPGDGLGEQFGTFDAGEDDAGSADVEGASDEGILEVSDADEGVEIERGGDAAEVLDGFEVEAAVFAIDEAPAEAGGGEDFEDFLGAELAEATAVLGLAGPEGGEEGVFAQGHGLSGLA